MENLHNLEILDCSFTKNLKEDSLISLLRKAPQLRIINVTGCKNLTYNFLKAVGEAVKTRNNFPIIHIFTRGTQDHFKNKISTKNRKKLLVYVTVSVF